MSGWSMKSKELVKLIALIQAKEKVLQSKMELLANRWEQRVRQFEKELEEKLFEQTDDKV